MGKLGPELLRFLMLKRQFDGDRTGVHQGAAGIFLWDSPNAILDTLGYNTRWCPGDIVFEMD